MKGVRSLLAAGACLLVTSCSEAAGPVGPQPLATSPRATLAPESYPHYATEADVPPEYSLAMVHRISPIVYWEGSYANASSLLSYFGNYGEQTLSLTVLKDGSALPAVTTTGVDDHIIPRDYEMVTSGLGFAVSGTCGWIGNLNVNGMAQILLLINVKGLTVLSTAKGTGTSSRAQPACASKTCTTVASNDQQSAYGGDYDPYAFDSPGTAACDGGAEDGNASGTQFQPGDMTGGETVDWRTGVGNGGASACGAAAQVDYMCVEYYVQGEGWKDLGCGYVTTC
jgi:hypothetical protein